MTLYVVEYTDYDDHAILGIYDSRALAEARIAAYRAVVSKADQPLARITEYALNEKNLNWLEHRNA